MPVTDCKTVTAYPIELSKNNSLDSRLIEKMPQIRRK